MDDELRRRRISGTEIPAVVGCDPRRDAHALWLIKKLLVQPEPTTFRQRMGKIFERPLATEYYPQVTGKEVGWLNITMIDPERPHMAATPDARIIGEERGLDVKLVSWDQGWHWGDTAEEMPEWIALQIYWYMEFFHYPVYDVLAWIGDDEPRIFTMHEDLELQAALVRHAKDFVDRYLVGDEMPPIGGSATTRNWLTQTFPRHRVDIRHAGQEEIAMLERYAAVREEAKRIKVERDKLENQIKNAIREAEGLKWPDGKFTWKKPQDSHETDWQSMALALLNNYIPDEEARTALLAQYTHTEPGTRRIHFRSDLFREEEEAA